MARGWESKAVEQQQEMASSDSLRKKVQLSPAQIADRQRKKALELSRQRILQQLEVASNPRHRKMLEAALADLDAQIGALPTGHGKIRL